MQSFAIITLRVDTSSFLTTATRVCGITARTALDRNCGKCGKQEFCCYFFTLEFFRCSCTLQRFARAVPNFVHNMSLHNYYFLHVRPRDLGNFASRTLLHFFLSPSCILLLGRGHWVWRFHPLFVKTRYPPAPSILSHTTIGS